ncbi:MAG: hypothetical protein GXO49_06340 [Chlorobi bacterium]|nr:hypothetical protein [Chlorobiota bacterium]
MDKNDFIKKRINFISLIWTIFIVELTIIFSIFYFLLTPKQLVQSKNMTDISILYIAYLVAIVAIPAVSKIYSIFKNKATKKTDLVEKLTLYQTSFTLKAIIFEFSAILLLVAFYLNEIYSPLYLFAAIIIAFFFNKPSVSNFKKDFDVKDENAIEPIEDEKITSNTKY